MRAEIRAARAELLRLQGREAESLTVLATVETEARALGEKADKVLVDLLTTRARLGDVAPEGRLTLLQEAVQLAERSRGKNTLELARARARFALALADAGQMDRARDAAAQAWPVLAQWLSEEDPDRQALARLQTGGA